MHHVTIAPATAAAAAAAFDMLCQASATHGQALLPPPSERAQRAELLEDAGAGGQQLLVPSDELVE